MSSIAVILADGSFPVHEIPLGYLREADHIICCDGSAESLLNAGLEPEAIVGDLDSRQSRDRRKVFRPSFTGTVNRTQTI